MNQSLLYRLDLGLRGLLPLFTALLAVLLDVLPLPNASMDVPVPFVTLCVIFYWSFSRPDLMTPLAAFIAGLFCDALGGMPLGMTSLAFLLAWKLARLSQKLLLAQTFLTVWASFAVAAGAVAVLRWGIASLVYRHVFDAMPAVAETVLTVAAYPVIGLLLGFLRPQLPGRADAAGS